MDRHKVSYSIKHLDDKNCGLLIDRSVTFNSFQDALTFIKKLRASKELVGSPLMESI